MTHDASAEYQFDGAKVRIHGNYDPEKIKEATTHFLKKVERSKNERNKKQNIKHCN